ncbi:MAG TPA: lipid A export permease/ATP-binding protein MsbA [Methylibium sp.]|nr:lipid A export permease/ATP-binding protein MsbA [Methylibium sp.]
MTSKPPNADLASLRSLWPYFSATRWALAAAAGAAAVASVTDAVVASLMQPLLDKGFQAGGLPLWMIPLAIIGLFAMRGLGGFIAQYALAWAQNHGTLGLRTAMFARLMDARPALYAAQSASALTNTVVYEVQTGSQMLVNALLTLVKDSLTALALLGYLLWMNWQLTLIVALLFPAVAVTMRYFGRRLRTIARRNQETTDELAYVVEENVAAWRLVRLHGAQAQQAQRFRQTSTKLRQLALKSTVASASVTPLTQILAACALSTVVVAALWQVQHQGGTVGGFVAFVTAMLMLITPLRHLSDIAGPITRGLTALQRGLALIEQTPGERGGRHAVDRVRGEIALESVALHYRDDQPALDGIDLVVHAGETVALVGPSGAGKTSLVNLLPRFIDPTAGRVRLDGVPLPDWELGALRRQFALVSQDVVLFNDSVAANVALGTEVDETRVRAALAAANLLDFVDGLPAGLHTEIGHNGSQLSGGQRQRLAIARAVYKDAPVLILDEATSALDSESERLVQQALERLMVGRTSIVIAHRLSTIEAADRVVVLDGGRVVEQGTHAELLARGGLFARLHALQFQT